MLSGTLVVVLCLVSQAGGASLDPVTIGRDLRILQPKRDPYVTLPAWLAETPRPPAASASRMTEIGRAWATLWADIQPADGAWTHPIISPGAHYLRGIWLWDTGFHVLGLLHGGPKARQLALWQIEVMLSGQHPTGRLPREIHRDGPKFIGEYGIQAPGILTLALNRLFDTATTVSERETLRKALESSYPKLVRNHEWFVGHLDQGRGLFRWQGLDSGWDNSPRWDTGTKEALDLDCWLYLDRVELAALARLLGKQADSDRWSKLAQELKGLIQQHHWNEELGAYNDTLPDGTVGSVITPVIFWPLWTGVATPEQAKRVLVHLQDPEQLGTPWPLPSAGKAQKGYDSRAYWRGPTWVNLNWIAIRGLQRYGFKTEAADLRRKTLALVARTPIPYEYYDSQTGAGLGSSYYGWTAALFIDLALDPE
jgi:glycogen debranching enzyme